MRLVRICAVVTVLIALPVWGADLPAQSSSPKTQKAGQKPSVSTQAAKPAASDVVVDYVDIFIEPNPAFESAGALLTFGKSAGCSKQIVAVLSHSNYKRAITGDLRERLTSEEIAGLKVWLPFLRDGKQRHTNKQPLDDAQIEAMTKAFLATLTPEQQQMAFVVQPIEGKLTQAVQYVSGEIGTQAGKLAQTECQGATTSDSHTSAVDPRQLARVCPQLSFDQNEINIVELSEQPNNRWRVQYESFTAGRRTGTGAATFGLSTTSILSQKVRIRWQSC